MENCFNDWSQSIYHWATAFPCVLRYYKNPSSCDGGLKNPSCVLQFDITRPFEWCQRAESLRPGLRVVRRNIFFNLSLTTTSCMHIKVVFVKISSKWFARSLMLVILFWHHIKIINDVTFYQILLPIHENIKRDESMLNSTKPCKLMDW